MLATKNFTKEDYNTIESNKKGTREYYMLFLKFFAPLSFFLGLIGLAKKGFGYWPTTLVILAICFLVTLYLVIKENMQYKKDLGAEMKFCGTITVLKKSWKKNDYCIYTDSKNLKKIDVYFPAIFDQIEEGDELYIEVAKFSKYIFRLDKGIVPLMNGHQVDEAVA